MLANHRREVASTLVIFVRAAAFFVGMDAVQRATSMYVKKKKAAIQGG